MSKRRFDIDWWRVIAIFAVYLHHICMPFNGDDFHIMNAESSKVLDDIMVFFEQFRLPLLFFVSGTGTVFAFSKRSWRQFIGERAHRLLIPLVFGVFILVPPQTYFENKQEQSSYFEFYKHIFSNIEANHLWFIENLFYLSILSIPVILYFRSTKSANIRRWVEILTSKRYGLFSLVLPLLLIKLVSKYYFPEDSKDFTNLSSTLFYGYFFVMGIVFTASGVIWKDLKNYRSSNLKMAVISLIVFYGYYFLPDEVGSSFFTIAQRWQIWYVVSASLSWALLITALGYGQVWFNKESLLVKGLNEAIYPFYMLHQTVIIILAYYIVKLEASIGLKIAFILLISFPIIGLIYRFGIYPFRVTRLLFGMKRKTK